MALKIRSRRYQILPAALFLMLAWPLYVTPVAAQIAQDDSDAEIAARLSGSGNDHTGIVQINQSAADGAQQANILSAASAASVGAAIVDSLASQHAADNQNSLLGDVRGVAISDSANASTGLVAINQSAAAGTSQINNSAIATTSGLGSLAFASAQSVSTGQDSAYLAALGAISTGPVSLSDSGNGSSGIFGINQAAAVGGSQANVLAVAVSSNGIANAVAAHTNRRGAGPANPTGTAGPVSIAGSFNAASGVVQINQSSGGYNSQSNLLAIAIGDFGDAAAISDSGLGAISPQSELTALAPARQAGDVSLASSFEGFSGIAQVSQVSGFGNAVNNNMAVTLTHIPGPGL